jgi:hypothetical protein
VKLHPASDGPLACGDPIEFTMLRGSRLNRASTPRNGSADAAATGDEPSAASPRLTPADRGRHSYANGVVIDGVGE